jgi:hypothetical protein
MCTTEPPTRYFALPRDETLDPFAIANKADFFSAALMALPFSQHNNQYTNSPFMDKGEF